MPFTVSLLAAGYVFDETTTLSGAPTIPWSTVNPPYQTNATPHLGAGARAGSQPLLPVAKAVRDQARCVAHKRCYKIGL